jgi:hypothetical protein
MFVVHFIDWTYHMVGCLIQFLTFFFFFLVGLGFKIRLLTCKAGHTLQPYLQSIFALVILEMGASQTICLGWLQTSIPPNLSLPSS